jgi:transcriptional antiterminator RfaH
MRHWHVIYTKPGKELLVSTQLEDRELEVFYPVIQVDRGHRRGIRHEPLFPHYLFTKVDLLSDEGTGLKYLVGVRTVVHVGERPAVVSEEVISGLRKRIRPYQDRVVPRSKWLFKPGQQVRIVDGPLKDLEAVFQRGLSGSERAEVLLHFLGTWNRATVDFGHLEPLSSRDVPVV